MNDEYTITLIIYIIFLQAKSQTSQLKLITTAIPVESVENILIQYIYIPSDNKISRIQFMILS